MPDYVGAVEPTAEDFAASFEAASPTPDETVEPAGLAFPEEHRLPFQGLLYVGALTKTFEWFGHTFTIRTLKTDELLEVGLLTSSYGGTIAEARAYPAAVVAACLETIDNQPLPIPIVDGTGSRVEYRFNWVRSKLYPPAVDAIYSEYKILEDQVDEIIETMGKAGGSTAG